MNRQNLNKQTLKQQSGLTLVELMVAMVISLLLIAGTITIFASNKQAYRLNEASSRVQENGRFAFDFMRPDVRMAGFVGCLSKNAASSYTNNVDPDGFDSSVTAEAQIKFVVDAFDGTNSMLGYTIPGAGLASGHDLYESGLRTGTAEGEAIAGTDAFIVTLGTSCDGGAVVTPYMNSTSANIKIADAAACGISQQSVVMISDCTNADLFRVNNNPVSGALKDTLAHTVGSSLNTKNTLSKAYGEDAEVFGLASTIYYIGNGASDEPALFRRRYSSAAAAIVNEELVEGVESMTILYGIDTDADGSVNYYVNADTVTTEDRWPNVNSARITIEVRSLAQNVVQSTTNADRKLRHTFTETIKIRNRI